MWDEQFEFIVSSHRACDPASFPGSTAFPYYKQQKAGQGLGMRLVVIKLCIYQLQTSLQSTLEYCLILVAEHLLYGVLPTFAAAPAIN